MRRWLRVLVCLFLICALLINLSPLRAEATAAGGAAIIKASTVTGNPYIIVGAMIIALGVWAGTESGVFESVVDNAVSYLDSAGAILADGTMQLLQTVTDAGQTAYYVAGDLFESLRSWAFSSSVVVCDSLFFDSANSKVLTSVQQATAYKYVLFCRWPTTSGFTYGVLGNNYSSFTYEVRGNMLLCVRSDDPYANFYYSVNGGSFKEVSNVCLQSNYSGSSSFSFELASPSSVLSDVVYTSLDLSLGNVSSVPIDGTSARTWAPDVADRNGLYVKYNNDPEPPDDNNGNWFWRLALPLTIAELIAMSQTDEWTGETPEEFPTGDTVTEFEILDRPEIDGYQGIEIAPITNPNPDTGGDTDPTAPGEPTEDPETDPTTDGSTVVDPGTGTNPDAGSDPDPDPDPGTDPDAGGDTGSDTGTGDGSGSGNTGNSGSTWVPPSSHNQFALVDLSKYFPFCIPFDLYDFFTLLDAEPVAPVLSWEIQDLSGQSYSLSVDLSEWDSVAQLFRRLQLFLFICGLAAASRKYIKW